MNNCSSEETGQTSEKWKDGFLALRKLKLIKYVNSKRLKCSGFLEQTKKNEMICDAGCGDLTLLSQLKSMGYNNLYGFDIDEDLINSSSPKLKNSFSEVKVGSACKIPFNDQLFDSVIIWGILHHIDLKDYKIVFSEVSRILKPNGKLFIVEPYPFFFWKSITITAKILSYLALPNCKNIHEVLSSENEILAVFSKNRKVLKEIIAKQYRQVRSKWHTGFWIFGGIRK